MNNSVFLQTQCCFPTPDATDKQTNRKQLQKVVDDSTEKQIRKVEISI